MAFKRSNQNISGLNAVVQQWLHLQECLCCSTNNRRTTDYWNVICASCHLWI